MIVIGTRGSARALAQTELMKTQILSHFPGTEISIKIIKTSADKDLSSSIRSGSSIGVFVKELEQALLSKEIDMAVHSMKDVPTRIPAGLEISAIPEREDAHDALIAVGTKSLAALPSGSLIGTGSVRRQSQLLALRPDLRVKDIRGNLQTRLNKLLNGEFNAIILACAGLNRLGLQDRISERLQYEQMLPAPGQGALAVETRVDDPRMPAIAAALNHAATAIAVSAERSFLQRMGGGCNVPVAAYAQMREGRIEIEGLAASPDGRTIVRATVQAIPDAANEAAISLADRILSQGGREILNEII
jgi:hydroxymethylbilane synthase